MQRVTCIGIGASAGGLEALQNLLAVLPVCDHFVYVVVQHLSKSHKSLLPTLLAKSTSIPVIAPQSGEALTPGNLYVIPPELGIRSRHHRMIGVEISDDVVAPHPSIDDIFTALATTQGSDVIGIILSGTGHDGTMGLTAIRNVGGITMVQLPSEAQYEGMPHEAIKSHTVDQVLPVAAMGAVLRGVARSDDEAPINALKQLLLYNEKFDLSQYKEKTVQRRIQKRMMLLRLESMAAYVAYMAHHREESRLLYHDLLIGVTKFFREPEAFEALQQQLHDKLKNEPERTQMRIWVTACSTGEEAYSIAIMMLELLSSMQRTLDVRIFATDIDDVALKAARDGSYAADAMEDLPAELIARYFTSHSDGYRVTDLLRQMVLFTHHDLLKDPPFLKMDLITCRNALIYFTPATQQEVFSIFHIALQEEGTLFLGISENASQHVNYFETLDSQWKIYKKEQLSNPPKLPKRFFQTYSTPRMPKTPTVQVERRFSDIEAVMVKSVYDFFIPSAIVIDHQNEIIYTKGKLPYLEFSKGFASLNLFKNLHPLLHDEVRLLLQQNAQRSTPCASKFVELDDLGPETLFVRALAMPIELKPENRYTLIYFQELSRDEMIYAGGSLADASETEMAASLKVRLSRNQTQLQMLQDEYDLLNENMQMIHEELQSSNEELQASNEELETSNEELQSSNDELGRSYAQVNALQKQLTLLLDSTPEAVLGFDMQGKHTFVNKAAAALLGYTAEFLISREGHAIWHHSKPDGSHYPIEECPVERVRSTGKPLRGTDHFWRNDGTLFEASYVCSPVFEEDQIAGSVLFFHDITEQKALERVIQYEQERSRRYLDVVGVMMIVLDVAGNIVLINRKGSQIIEEKPENLIGLNWFDHFIAPQDNVLTRQVFDKIIAEKNSAIVMNTNEILTRSGEKRLIFWTNTPLFDDQGKILNVIAAGSDITEMSELKARLTESEKLYELTFRQANVGIAHVGLDGAWRDVNDMMCEIMGYSKAELMRLTFQEITHPDDLQKDLENVEALIAGEIKSYQMDKRYIRKDGVVIWVSLSVALVRDSAGVAQYFISIILDITKQYELMASVREKEELMIAQSRLAAMGEMLSMIAHQWRQPLTTIAMAANNLLADVDLETIDSGRIKLESNAILDQTQYLSQTIEDFRNFFKTDKVKEALTLDDVIQDALRVVSKSFEAHLVTCKVENHSHSKIPMFAREMQQVLINILRNAKEALVEYRQENRDIAITIEENAHEARLQICNNGGEIAPEVIDRIFEPYFSTKDEQNGTGLGLYMSKTIIEKHMQGALEVNNIEGGVCFKITLPLHPKESPDA